MASRGFQIGRDPRIQKDYKCLNKDHWYGRKGDLEFKASRYPAGWKIEFFQNIFFENSNGGEYDFDKYQKMPYLIKLLFRNELRHIRDFLLELGCPDVTKPIYTTAEDKIKHGYVESWDHPQKDVNFDLWNIPTRDDIGDYNRRDRDKKLLNNGELKYFRDFSGYLARGMTFHNINNMWWVITDRNTKRNLADFELFDPTPIDFVQRRKKRDRKPESYLKRRAEIEKTKTSELVRELRRRQISVG
jgi:hypothetical protein